MRARSLFDALLARDDLEVGAIRSSRPGLGRTIGWLSSGAGERLKAARADLLHCPNFVTPWRVSVPYVVTIFDLSTRKFPRDHPLEWRGYERPSCRRGPEPPPGSSPSAGDPPGRHRRVRVMPERVVTVRRAWISGTFATSGAAAGRGPPLIFPGAPVARKNLTWCCGHVGGDSRQPARRACLEISGATADRFPEQAARIATLGLAKRCADRPGQP